MIVIIKRLAGALWPLLFIPVILVVVKSKTFGAIDPSTGFGETLAYVAAIYAAIYCAFWAWGKEHGMSAVSAAVITVGGVALWQTMYPIALSTLP